MPTRRSLFRRSQISTQTPTPRIARCGACGLATKCLSPKMPYSGEGRREVLIVGEAPDEQEDRRGTQLVGEPGQFLRRSLRKIDVDLDRDCWKTNSVICRPPNSRPPTPKEIDHCYPFLAQTIAELQPKVIILLGPSPIKSLIRRLWKSDIRRLERWLGQQIPSHVPNAWICPTYHPSHVLKTSNERGAVSKVIFERHLASFFSLTSRPWKKSPPKFADQVSVMVSPTEAAKEIHRNLSLNPHTITFDFEANCLKPEHPKARIYCCSFHFEGGSTIAFPWQGEAIEAAKNAIESSVGKIASNAKFEDRWCRKFGIRPRNWVWDTMLQGHIHNNARGATGLKFLAYVLLGQSNYDSHLEPFLRSEGDNRINRIDEIDLRDLLLYCGMDSLLEFNVALKQSRLMGLTR